MEVLGRSFNHFSPKFVQKAPYRLGIADSGPGFKNKSFPDGKISKITPGPKNCQVTILRPDLNTMSIRFKYNLNAFLTKSKTKGARKPKAAPLFCQEGIKIVFKYYRNTILMVWALPASMPRPF